MKLYFVEFSFVSTFVFILYFCVTYVLCVLCMSSWVSIKMSHVYLKGLLIQIKFVAFSSQIFFQSFFVESKFLIFCIVTQIGASFDHFPYFSDLTEYRVRFVLVSNERKHASHAGRNFFQLDLLLAHCALSLRIGKSIQNRIASHKKRYIFEPEFC